MICVECGGDIAETAKVSHGNVRLNRCSHCHKIADKYVEHDFVVIFLDLILLKPQVYRHILFNRLPHKETGIHTAYIKLFLISLFFSTYVQWYRLLKRHEEPFSLTTSIFSFSLATHYNGEGSDHAMAEQHLFIFCAVTLEVLAFMLSVVVLVACRAKSLGLHIKYNYLIMAIILANFGKPLFLLMIVWDYPLSFIVVLNVFLLSSLVVSLKVFLNSRTLTALVIVFVSFAVQLGCRLMLHLYEPGYIVFIV